MDARVHVLHHRDGRVLPAHGRHDVAQAVGGFAHQRRVRRHRHRQLHGLADTARGQFGQGAVHCGGVAADDDLAGRIVVGRHHHAFAGGGGADFLHHRVLGAEHGRHGAGARGHGLLHQAAAFAHQAGTVGQAQASGSHQRGVFAQAVAGQHRRAGAALRQPGAPHGHAGRKQRGLGELGLVELVFGALLGQRPEVNAGAFGRFVEGFAHQRLRRGKVGQHAQGLGALAGEYEGEHLAHRESAQWCRRMISEAPANPSVPARRVAGRRRVRAARAQ